MLRPLIAGLAAVALSAPAAAGEVFGGLFVHDVETPLTASGEEGGVDLQLGYRFDPLMSDKGPQPYLFASVNSSGETNYAALGLSMKFGDKIFIRPGLGLAVHTGSAGNFDHLDHDHVDFGSRVLFAPELGIGVKLSDRASVEASWVHLSHAQLFGQQNPGMDNIGARMSFRF